jgi:hypothetical protein
MEDRTDPNFTEALQRRIKECVDDALRVHGKCRAHNELMYSVVPVKNPDIKNQCVYAQYVFYDINGKPQLLLKCHCPPDQEVSLVKYLSANLVQLITAHHDGKTKFNCLSEMIFDYDEVSPSYKINTKNIYMEFKSCSKCRDMVFYNDGGAQLIAFDNETFNCCMCGKVFTDAKNRVTLQKMIDMCSNCQARPTEVDLDKTFMFINTFIVVYFKRMFGVDVGFQAQTPVAPQSKGSLRVDCVFSTRLADQLLVVLLEIDADSHGSVKKEEEVRKNEANLSYMRRVSDDAANNNANVMLVRLNITKNSAEASTHYLVFRAWLACFFLYPENFKKESFLYLFYAPDNKHIAKDLTSWAVQSAVPFGVYSQVRKKILPTMAFTINPWLALFFDKHFPGNEQLLHIFRNPEQAGAASSGSCKKQKN